MDDSGNDEQDSMSTEDGRQPGPDEVFCTDCGSVIKKNAEICPECGVPQQTEQNPPAQHPEQGRPQNAPQGPPQNAPQTGARNAGLTDRRKYELEKIASKDKATVLIVGFLLSPVAYWMIGKRTLAIVNFLTLNYFLLGVVVVPVHCYSIISDAEEELRRAGVGGY